MICKFVKIFLLNCLVTESDMYSQKENGQIQADKAKMEEKKRKYPIAPDGNVLSCSSSVVILTWKENL